MHECKYTLCQVTHVEVRGQLPGGSFLLPWGLRIKVQSPGLEAGTFICCPISLEHRQTFLSFTFLCLRNGNNDGPVSRS